VRPLIRRVLGRNFYCLPDQSAPDMDVAALEKRRCNAVLARFCRFKRGLDAFAGVGVSSRYWSACTGELYLVENRLEALRLLRKNLAAIQRPSCRLHVLAGTARAFLEKAVSEGIEFDLIDCDPFGTCYELLPLIATVVPRGIVCITSGEIFQVYRGLNRRPDRAACGDYRGHKVLHWVVGVLLPELMSAFKGARIAHFYAYPTSVRVVLSVGGFPLPSRAFWGRPRFLGWLASDGATPAVRAQVRDILQSAD
jgi:hypothetical protein